VSIVYEGETATQRVSTIAFIGIFQWGGLRIPKLGYLRGEEKNLYIV
jgi:hypothetical protein